MRRVMAQLPASRITDLDSVLDADAGARQCAAGVLSEFQAVGMRNPA